MSVKTNNQRDQEFAFLKIPIEEFLSQDDIDFYRKLKDTLSSHICRNCRNRRCESFNQILSTINYYINHKKDDKWKRSIICGVCWYNNYLCVNIRQMSFLLEKCKSSINGSLQRLSLMVLNDKRKSYKILIEAIPYLKSNSHLLHMWSVREYKLQVQKFVPLVFLNQTENCQNYYQYNIQNISIPQKNTYETNRKIITKVKKETKVENQKEISTNIVQDENPEINNLFNEVDLLESIFDRYDYF